MTSRDPTLLSSLTELDDVDVSLVPKSLEEVSDALLPAPILVPVSGRYRAISGNVRLELRVDVDGVRPQQKLSGDFFSVSGTTESYRGSFIVDSPEMEVSPTSVTIRGAGRFNFGASAPLVETTIARVSRPQPPGPAIVRFATTTGVPESVYTASRESPFFRSVTLEIDRASDVRTTSFVDYDTNRLQSAGPRRKLSVAAAFAEAGIEMIPTIAGGTVDIAEAGTGATWSDAELLAAMTTHFSRMENSPQPVVWLLEAEEHDEGLRGVMFDKTGDLPRQGCAVFYHALLGDTKEGRRRQLHTYMHELGHCFNLLHSWEKEFARPHSTSRPEALSWMNNDELYPGGPESFWPRFPFRFDRREVIHLRHGFRDNVLMGGSPFSGGAALASPAFMVEPFPDRSGLRVEIIGVHLSFALGEPVVLQLGIRSATPDKHRAHTCLHPSHGLTKIIIAKPNGNVVSCEPYMEHVVAVEAQEVGAKPIESSAYIGYGRGGHYFDQPGSYRIRAAYHGLDGSTVFSNVATIRVRRPASREDEDIAALMLGDDQGRLLCLKGSDSEHLRRGNAAFEKLLDKYPTHPVANYVRFVKGHNWTRKFKSIDPDTPNRVRVRDRDLNEAAALLDKATCDTSRLDDISKGEARAVLAAAADAAGAPPEPRNRRT